MIWLCRIWDGECGFIYELSIRFPIPHIHAPCTSIYTLKYTCLLQVQLSYFSNLIDSVGIFSVSNARNSQILMMSPKKNICQDIIKGNSYPTDKHIFLMESLKFSFTILIICISKKVCKNKMQVQTGCQGKTRLYKLDIKQLVLLIEMINISLLRIGQQYNYLDDYFQFCFNF